MNESEVVKILGEPSSKAANKDGSEIYYYTLNEAVMGEYPVPYDVHFVGGKVDSYEREAGGSQFHPNPVVIPTVH